MIIIVALVGSLLGVLVNLLSDSLPYFRRLRSFHCHSCGSKRKPVAWSGVIGVILGNRICPYCQTPRPWRAAIVEIALTAIAVLLYTNDPSLKVFIPSLAIVTIYLLITVIDIEHRLILHMVSFPSALIIGLIGIIDPARGVAKTLSGGAGGFAIFLVLYFLGQGFAALMSKIRGSQIEEVAFGFGGSQIEEVAFGFGDVTLAGVIGLTVGWPGVIPALVTGILAAGIFSFLFIIGMMLRRNYNPFMPIPYGPFMILGCMITYFGGRDFFAALISG
jgi:prepilin signal peptidase PulO-like enzyme (type II secretory pathway)